jgi:hypothetical protein
MLNFFKNLFSRTKRGEDMRCACNRNYWACTYPACKNGK